MASTWLPAMVTSDVDLESAPTPISPRNLASAFEPEALSTVEEPPRSNLYGQGHASTSFVPESQAQISNLTMLISPEDVVTPRDMTGMPCHAPDGLSEPREAATLSSPQHLRASAVARSRIPGDPEEHVEVIVSGAQPYINKTPWSPQLFSSPGKTLDSSIAKDKCKEDSLDGLQLSGNHKFLVQQLALLDVVLADEIIAMADKQRMQRLRGWEVKPSTSMEEAISIIAECRKKEPYSPIEAENIVRSRTGMDVENPLHVYGFLIHLINYWITILLALAGYVQMAIIVTGKVGIETKSISRTVFLVFLGFVLGLPISAVCVALGAVPDILLLLFRPLLPVWVKLKLTQWFFPTSLAFWSCCCLAPFAHLLLGACPIDQAFVNMSMGGELCNVQLERNPPSTAFQAAVACAPYFLARHKNLRRIALRGVPEFYAPAGGPMAKMPQIVQWGYLLGDTELCAAWEAETMGCLPPQNKGLAKAVTPGSNQFGFLSHFVAQLLEPRSAVATS